MDKLLFSFASPKSGYSNGFTPERLILKHSSLNPSPIIGRCISEIKISSEKTSPLPTPITLNFPKMKSMKFIPRHPIIKKAKIVELKEITPTANVAIKEVKKKSKKINKEVQEKKGIKARQKNRLSQDIEKNLGKIKKKLTSKKDKIRKEKFPSVSEPAKSQKKIIKIKDMKLKKKAKPRKTSNTKDLISRFRSSKVVKKIIKIQSFFRGYLVRKRLNQFKNISLEYSNHVSSMISSQNSHLLEDLEIQKHLSNRPDNSKLNLCPAYQKDSSLPLKTKSLILSEISLKLKQSAKLKELQENDLKEIKDVAKKFDSKSELVDIFSNIIRKRYDKLETFFTDSIQRLQSHLINLEIEENDTERSFSKHNENDLKNNLESDSKNDSKNVSKNDSKNDSKNVSKNDSENGSENGSENDLEKILLEIEKMENQTGPVFYSSHQSAGIASKNQFIYKSADLETSEEEFITNIKFPSRSYSSVEVPSEPEPVPYTFESKSLRKIVWPSQRSESCKSISELTAQSKESLEDSLTDSISDSSYTVNRVINLLEVFIYNDIIENHSDMFNDEQFLLRLCDAFIYKHVEKSLLENARILKSNHFDTMKLIDESLLETIKQPNKLKNKISDLINPLEYIDRTRVNQKLDFLAVNFFKDAENDFGGNKRATFSACSQAMVMYIEEKRGSCFDYCKWEIESLKLTDLFMNAREKVYDWNEIRTGNLPTEEMLDNSGKIDEDKLQNIRLQSIAKALYFDLFEGNKSWFNYLLEEEQTIFHIEGKVFIEILNETISILSII